MRVYGDQVTLVSPANALDDQTRAAEAIMGMSPGIGRHAAVVGLFIEAAKLVQGIADHDLKLAGGDGASGTSDTLMVGLMALAGAVMRSWDSGFISLDLPAPLPTPSDLPPEVEVRSPEGYAHYGLYPEAYALAARRLPRSEAPTRVIGIRSIGTGLAALVGRELGAEPPFTVRPQGHPFARQVQLADGALDRLLVQGGRYVVVDEGPGLSGSSFAAVADLLMSAGVGPDRIVLMPSHAGRPGPEASAATRRVWDEVMVEPVSPGTLITDERVLGWASTLLGPLHGAVHDLGGGGWRSDRDPDRPCWDPRTDRRKLLVRTAEGAWLLKFSGLGADGERKADRGKRLTQAGLIPEVRGIVHGFLVQRWAAAEEKGARPTLEELAHYLAERARCLPEPCQAGASLSDLAAMAVFNTGIELGQVAGDRLRQRLGDADRLQPLSRPMATDGKLDPWEWLRLADGRVMKADALDHDAEHDMVGAQDLAWDVVGAATELRYAVADLTEEMERRGARKIDTNLLAFLMPCYLAFRMGAARMAERMQDEVEGRLSAQAAEDYAERLSHWLEAEVGSGRETRPAVQP